MGSMRPDKKPSESYPPGPFAAVQKRFVPISTTSVYRRSLYYSPLSGGAKNLANSSDALGHICSLFVMLLILTAFPSKAQGWIAEGPGPNRNGQVENIKDGEVAGAIRTVAPHPTDNAIVYVGTVNGGIWKTNNGDSSSPNWKHLSDDQASLSIGALEFDPTDTSYQTLVAGTGRFSSFGDGGALIGLLRTTNGGASWSVISGNGQLQGLNVSGIAPRGKIILASVNYANDSGNVGIWRTDNGGDSWAKISGTPGTGLPAGGSAGLAGDPTNRGRFFTNAGTVGLYRSNDSGASWTKVGDPRLDSLVRQADNIKISVGNHNSLYVAIDVAGKLSGIFHSKDGGDSWGPMDLPGIDEGGINPGGQGRVHLSLTVDPADANVVYIGGDSQPAKFVDGIESNPPIWPNSVGAMNYSGRIFRGDALKPSGSQWVHITHSKDLGPRGSGTKSCSAPHADSRGMVIDVNGDLLEVDDGGIYRRTNPRSNAGDWFSMNGNIEATEFHSVAWDPNSHVVVGGAQDTGTPEQWPPSTLPWQSVSTSDGGVVAVGFSGTVGYSVRYSSAYSLIGFRRQTYDSKNIFQREEFLQLAPLDKAPVLQPQFYTPIKINTIIPTRIIIGGANSVYESFDQGDTISEIGPGIIVNAFLSNPIAYGAKGNPDVLYVGAGKQIYVRKSASPSPLQPCSKYNGDTVSGIAINPEEPRTAFVVSSTAVYLTSDAGDSWVPITGNLLSLSPGVLRSVTYNPVVERGAAVVGSDAGVFVASGPEFSTWSRLAQALPNVPIYHVEYSSQDDLYLIGTLGRGAWTLRSFSDPRRIQSKHATGSREFPSLIHQSDAHPVADDIIQEKQASLSHIGPIPRNPNQFELSPGVIVDQSGGHVYAMAPDGGIQALRIATGEVLWATKEAAKPIGLTNGRLICQSESSGSAHEVTIVVLDPETGKKIVSNSALLPPNVVPSVTENRRGNFVASADSFDGSTVVSWQFVKRAQQGLPPSTKATLSSSEVAPDIAPSQPDNGAFRINLATGQISPVAAADVMAQQLKENESPQTSMKVLPVVGRQYLSADGLYILVSDEKLESKTYLLTIFNGRTGIQLGSFQSPVPVLRFFVEGSRIIYESRRRLERNKEEQPRKLISLDLATGHVWTVILRDTEYLGPFPP